MDWAGSMNIVFEADLSTLRRAPPERPVLGAAAGRRHRRHRHRPRADGAPVERVADRLGLRHQRARRRRSTRRWRPRSCTTWSATTRSTSSCARRRCGATTRCTPTRYADGPRVLHGRRLPPAPAEQRPRLEHVDPGRVQPRLEARARAARARRRRRCWTPTTPSARRSASRSSTRANKSIEEFGPIFDALGLLDTDDPEQMRATSTRARTTRRRAPTQRAKLRDGDRAQELRVQRARRRARPALPLGRRRAATARPSRRTTRDPELYYHPTTWPGARLPHAGSSTAAASGLHARPRRQGPVHAAHRHRRRRAGWRPPRR